MKGPSSRPDPDSALIRRAQAGDEAALKELLMEVTPVVQRWAMARCGERDDAEDLTQEVLILLVRKLTAFRGTSRFLTWLFTVTRNQALDAHRQRQRHERKMERFGTQLREEKTTSPPPDSEVEGKRIHGLVSAFLKDLPDRQREVFQMADLQGFSPAEIGKILGVAPGAVRAALFKARRSIRHHILANHPEFVEEYLQ